MSYFRQVFDKLRWLVSTPAFKQHPLQVVWNCLAWELVCWRGAPIRWKYDSRFEVTLRPREGASRLAYYFGYSEPDLFNLYQKIIRPGMVVVDAGANIGLHSLFFSRLVGTRGRIYAFEPDPHNFQRLQEHILRNSIANIIATPCALGESLGSMALVHDTRDSSRSYLASDSPTDRASSIVRVLTLDEYAARHSLKEIDFLKADIEGHELSLLRGSRDLIKRRAIKIMQLEVEQQNLVRSRSQTSEILDLMAENAYVRCEWSETRMNLEPSPIQSALGNNPIFCHRTLLT